MAQVGLCARRIGQSLFGWRYAHHGCQSWSTDGPRLQERFHVLELFRRRDAEIPLTHHPVRCLPIYSVTCCPRQGRKVCESYAGYFFVIFFSVASKITPDIVDRFSGSIAHKYTISSQSHVGTLSCDIFKITSLCCISADSRFSCSW